MRVRPVDGVYSPRGVHSGYEVPLITRSLDRPDARDCRTPLGTRAPCSLFTVHRSPFPVPRSPFFHLAALHSGYLVPLIVRVPLSPLFQKLVVESVTATYLAADGAVTGRRSRLPQ